MSDIPRDAQGRPRVYLEDDCPVAELSVESQRERGASSALPPLYFLHVWWARRPLTVSRASVLGSLLPSGMDRKDFLALMGVPRGSDPIGARQKIDEVKAGIRKERIKDPYGYPRAFTGTISTSDYAKMQSELERMWGTKTPTVLDSFAGGGSIPFEAYRMGLNVIMNELNPVASIIERATIEYPALFGKDLAKDIEAWGNKIVKEVKAQMADCFPRKIGESDLCYIWARTVECPNCQLQIPLSPNWWLDKKKNLGYNVVVPPMSGGNVCYFKITSVSETFDPDNGSITKGIATCPRCAVTVEGETIKNQAQAEKMGLQIAAIGFKMKNKKGRYFREATKEDLNGYELAKKLLAKKLPDWEVKGLVPNEFIPEGNKTNELRNKGSEKWIDLFNPRQLLVHLTTLESILNQPWQEVRDPKRREALRVYLAFVLDKQISYDSLQSRYDSGRGMRNLFERHDFAYKWSPGEIDGAGQLQEWAISQITQAYAEIAALSSKQSAQSTFIQGDASKLNLKDKSVECVSIDPPYYDNVMYAELSDFFYVWLKRSLNDVFPEWFTSELTDKEAEAVANKALFKTASRGKASSLADKDYTAKMQAAFCECHRVLKDEGVLTIMFTHKKVEAWDSLARALMDAGFEITATWPVHTESEHSQHQAKQNAAASTILLVCRKRSIGTGEAWWDDIKDELRSHVRERAKKFSEMGLRGQDTSIACFGPALQVISRQWPVKLHSGEPINPDMALDLARKEVNDWFFELIAEGKAKAVDKWTKFYILSWFHFGAREFPYDEARKLALAVDVDIDKDLIAHKILEKKGNNVRMLKPGERFQKGAIKPTAISYNWDVDYVHAAIHAYDTGQSSELTRYHQRTAALTRDSYKHAIGYLLDVLPRTDEVSEYASLDKLWEANFRDSVKRRAVKKTDPTLEKQQRLDIFKYEE
ncbi:MAG: DUF1156 domain-containing protein [Candidatus Thermoplasmatota archaeon]|nr:DUF1156 domain-containing protein [Euryarchaeota archaeon]MBU4031381.1 DUF1156 domain-containing protein [Candidatus Thermoplasmatota archaeon]MBU4145292.1 DUF1156 domain-containing protein [Candidatus Thermoplasmatota archaeon]MBU4591226.1 DUF1156 domain-containing protein [Candidatus Thermoplasmatota archaeon]